MTAISAFDDVHLDGSIAAILRLPDGVAEKLPARDIDQAPSWWRFLRSHQASVTVAAALGIASIGAVVLLIGQRNLLTNGLVVKTPSAMRRVVDLAVPATPSSSLTDVVAETAIATSSHRWRRHAWRRRKPSHQSSVEPATAIVDAIPLVSQPASEDLVDREASVMIVAGPTVPEEAPAVPRDVAQDQTTASTDHARRDSIDAIRALRREY